VRRTVRHLAAHGEFDKTSLANPITLKSYRQRELSSDMMGANKNEKEFKV